jgi:tol-pal system protein YbgF
MFEIYLRHLNKAVYLCVACAMVALLPSAAVGQTTDLAGRVAKLEQTLSNRGLLDLLREIENLKRQVASLRGELENQTYTIEQLKKSQTAAYVDLEQRVQALTPGSALAGAVPRPVLPVLQAAPQDAVAGAPAVQGDLQVQTESALAARPDSIDAGALPVPPAIDPVTGLAMIPTPTPGSMPVPGQMDVRQATPPEFERTPDTAWSPDAPAAPVMAPVTADDAGSEAAYRDAFALLKSGEYDQAIAAFDAFQQQYPTSQYGDNAQFWLAEAHYVKRDFAAALPAYQKMLSSYPASKKLSHAMLKIGYSYSELGQVAEARAVLTDLQQRFPGSAAAQLAEQRVAQLPAN